MLFVVVDILSPYHEITPQATSKSCDTNLLQLNKVANVLLRTEQPVAVSRAQNSQPQLLLSGFGGEDHFSPTQLLDEAAVEHEDDDYWDVQSDEEMGDAEDGADENSMLASKDFSMIRRIHFENSNELGIRRYDAFLYDGLLTKYRPEYAASPLRNSKTARVFAHFIHVVSSFLLHV